VLEVQDRWRVLEEFRCPHRGQRLGVEMPCTVLRCLVLCSATLAVSCNQRAAKACNEGAVKSHDMIGPSFSIPAPYDAKGCSVSAARTLEALVQQDATGTT
jgi:hypothetical protein